MSNLCPEMDSSKWYSWSILKEPASLHGKEILNGEKTLKISSGGRFEHYGKWLCCIDGIKGGETCKFSVEYATTGVMDENVSIAAILTWKGEGGSQLARDYVDNVYTTDSGWTGLYRVIETPSCCTAVTIELSLRWSVTGSVQWRRPVFQRIAPISHRNVKIAVASIIPGYTAEANLASIKNILDRAGEQKPDIICMGETCYSFGTPLSFADCAETVPGRLTRIVSGKAILYNTYIIFNLIEKDRGLIFNTSVLFDRNGKIAGKYRKTHLPLIEAESGVTPGSEYPVFTTDFGVIGIMTCWDQYYPETARIIRKNGAEIIFVPTLGYTPLQSRARAADNGVYVVVSGAYGPPADHSCIIAPDGKPERMLENWETQYFIHEVDLDKRFLTEWLSIGPGDGEARSLYLKERRTDTYARLVDGSP